MIINKKNQKVEKNRIKKIKSNKYNLMNKLIYLWSNCNIICSFNIIKN